MSKVAGLLLIILGAGIAYVGLTELLNPGQLTTYGAASSVVLGLLVVVAGLGHFKAPHKAFLLGVPVLVAFQLHAYCMALFFDVKNLPLFLGGFLVASALIILLSYNGYRVQQNPAA